ncbi:hypothetical protein RQP46_002033 [Phenoliferia psychrophenolica]
MSTPLAECAVCASPAKLRCSRCKCTPFCSTEHQTKLWSSHKHLCKPNTPLEFHQPPLKREELDNYFFGADDDESGQQCMTRVLMLRHSSTSPKAAELQANMVIAWKHFQRALKLTPTAAGRDVIIGFARGSYATESARLHGPSKVPPFTRLAMLLIGKGEDRFDPPRADGGREIHIGLPFHRLSSLPPAQKLQFELQALILVTLMEEEEPSSELVDLAMERLKTIAGGDVEDVVVAFEQFVADAREPRAPVSPPDEAHIAGVRQRKLDELNQQTPLPTVIPENTPIYGPAGGRESLPLITSLDQLP